jgi:glycosyltransferase involved in cell wall biosynthesis
MHCPSLSELPSPPLGKTGWPWTEESPQLPDFLSNSLSWPKISIVTPNYNYGQLLEGTIRSVLLQGYPNLEYIIIDGGSTDNSIEIIKKYESWLTYWISEPDRGQSHAINKGISLCNGEIFNWLNSDDQLAPGALAEVARVWIEKFPHLVVGRGLVIEAESQSVLHDWHPKPPRQPLDFLKPNRVVMTQPSTFLALNLVKKVGGLKEDLLCILDWELYLRLTVLLRGELKAAVTQALLSKVFIHSKAKTVRQSTLFKKEALQVLKELRSQLPLWQQLRLVAWIRHKKALIEIDEAFYPYGNTLLYLALLPFRWPGILISRFFWGAVRKTIKSF